ncbi:MAG: hypothetical protein ACE5HV_08245 [Acidobacteriota bacterium]
MRISALRFIGGAVGPLLLALVWVLVPVSQPAEAIPAFARKYELPCTQCHSAWPKLNAYGRDFKMNGYRIPGEAEEPGEFNQEISDLLVLGKNFPITGRLVMRPFDKKKNKRFKVRSLHEMEVIIAGRVYKNVSTWLEFEGEDEENFNLTTETGVIGWHPRKGANFVLGWASPFWADPFDTLADGGRRMTRAHKGPLDLKLSAREPLRKQSQWFGFYGRGLEDRVFYLGGVSSGANDPEGEDARDGFGRVMVEAAPGVYVGGFALAGSNETQARDLDFSRTGIDFQIEQGNLNLYGMIMRANDDLLAGGDESETVGYVQGFYTIPMHDKRMIVPLVRLELLNSVTGGTTNIAANLNYYFAQNGKIYFEWFQNVDTPAGLRKNNRGTLQLDFVF